MMSSPRSVTALLALIAYLSAGLGGVPLVLCEGRDGHRGIEIAHEAGQCDEAAKRPALEAVVEGVDSSPCEDTLLRGVASAELRPTRLGLGELWGFASPPLLGTLWTEPARESITDDHWLTRTAAVHTDRELDVVRSVVLLI